VTSLVNYLNKKRSSPLISPKLSFSHTRYNNATIKEVKRPFEAMKRKPEFRNNLILT
jgi:hypothetical protein